MPANVQEYQNSLSLTAFNIKMKYACGMMKGYNFTKKNLAKYKNKLEEEKIKTEKTIVRWQEYKNYKAKKIYSKIEEMKDRGYETTFEKLENHCAGLNAEPDSSEVEL